MAQIATHLSWRSVYLRASTLEEQKPLVGNNGKASALDERDGSTILGDDGTYIICRTSPSETDPDEHFPEENLDTSFDMNIVQGIFERCEKLAPSLNNTSESGQWH